MNRSVKFKILATTLVAFAAAAAATVLVAGVYQKDIVDHHQERLYAEKLSAIFNILNQYHEELVHTGMVELYGEEARNAALDELRRLYYKGKTEETYPFIMTGDGAFLLHPTLTPQDNIKDFSFGQSALDLKEGELYYTFQEREKWMRIRYFTHWNWIIGYVVPLEIKYADTAQMRNMLLLTMAAITAAVMLAFSFIVSRKVINPVKTVTHELRESSENVMSGAEQVSSASQSLADSASRQASFLEEISSATEEMAAMARQNQEHIHRADQIMKSVRQAMEGANDNMTELTRSMRDISEAGRETSKIIKTIDEIAFQTNLLALNAAVEAARAGGAGAGFAVVADEVRSLAKRAADAVKTTSDLIETSGKKIRDGAHIVEAVSNGYAGMTGSVVAAEALLDEIAAATRDQTEGISQINTSVMEMEGMVQQNAANSEETASASEQMRDQSDRLGGMVTELLGLFDGRAEKNGASRRPARIQERRIAPKRVTNRKAANNVIAYAAKARPSDAIPFDDDELRAF